MQKLAVGAVLGWLVAHFLDPTLGRRRRAVGRDRTLAFFRRTGRRAERAGRHARAEAYGVAQKVQHLHEEPKEFDDTTLARKVETEIFRDADVPKGQINVNSQKGIIQLRGEVPSQDMMRDLVERTLRIQGVRSVENLLHLPGGDAPMHQ
jgi:osmotically-inducible protein OsmY